MAVRTHCRSANRLRDQPDEGDKGASITPKRTFARDVADAVGDDADMPATTRRQMLIDGHPRAVIDRLIRSNELRPVHPGYYALDAEWTSRLEAHLLRGGPGSLVSHRAAARLHGFDGYTESEYEDVTVPIESRFRSRPAFRALEIDPSDSVLIGTLPVTSIVQTLLDLGRVSTADQYELALESVLRGPDPKRPDVWNEAILAELVARLIGAHGPGVSIVREVVARRPVGARPTGSYSETLALQSLRRAGLGDIGRQPNLTIDDAALGNRGTWFPDFFHVASGVAIEIDGEAGHAPLDARRRDGQRDNVLGNVVIVKRYTASDVQAFPEKVGREIALLVAQRLRTGWLPVGWTVVGAGNHWRAVRAA
jgi:hypothetical protein